MSKESVGAGDLKSAIKDALSRSGVLSEVKGKLRAEVFKTIEDKDIARRETDKSSSSSSAAIRITSALVQEYLARSRLECSLAVYRDESRTSQDDAVLDRGKLAATLGLDLATSGNQVDLDKVPLLVLLVQHLLDTP